MIGIKNTLFILVQSSIEMLKKHVKFVHVMHNHDEANLHINCQPFTPTELCPDSTLCRQQLTPREFYTDKSV